MRCKESVPFSKINDGKGTHYVHSMVYCNINMNTYEVQAKASQITNSMKVKL